jgi:hypothetical protein
VKPDYVLSSCRRVSNSVEYLASPNPLIANWTLYEELVPCLLSLTQLLVRYSSSRFQLLFRGRTRRMIGHRLTHVVIAIVVAVRITWYAIHAANHHFLSHRFSPAAV